MKKCSICHKKFHRYEDFLNIKKHWGYYSDFDLEYHELRICCKCYKSFINWFKKRGGKLDKYIYCITDPSIKRRVK